MSLPKIGVYDLPDTVQTYLPGMLVDDSYNLDFPFILSACGWLLAGCLVLFVGYWDRKRAIRARANLLEALVASGGSAEVFLGTGRKPPVSSASLLAGILWILCGAGVFAGFKIHKEGLAATARAELDLYRVERSHRHRMEQSARAREMLAGELGLPVIDESMRDAFLSATESLPKGSVRIGESIGVRHRADVVNWTQQVRELLTEAGYSDTVPWEGLCGTGIEEETYKPVPGVKPAGLPAHVAPLLDAFSAAGLTAWDEVEIVGYFHEKVLFINVAHLPGEPPSVAGKAADANPEPFATE